MLSNLPIKSLLDFLTMEVIEKHLDSLSPAEMSSMYGPLLPKTVGTDPTKQNVLETVRSPFFQQACQRLSEQLAQGEGAGYLLAQSLKLKYDKEGIASFLQGLRDANRGAENDDKHPDKS